MQDIDLEWFNRPYQKDVDEYVQQRKSYPRQEHHTVHYHELDEDFRMILNISFKES